MKKIHVLAALVAACAPGARAYQVFCNFDGVQSAHTDPSAPDYTETTYSTYVDYVEYKVVVGASESLTDFFVGKSADISPSSYWASQSTKGANLTGWSVENAGQLYASTYTPDGKISMDPENIVPALHYSGNTALTAGTYYFGYDVANGTYALNDTDWRCVDPTQGGDWGVAVSDDSGLGPVHMISPVPEPSTFALALVGLGALAIRRRRQRR